MAHEVGGFLKKLCSCRAIPFRFIHGRWDGFATTLRQSVRIAPGIGFQAALFVFLAAPARTGIVAAYAFHGTGIRLTAQVC